MWDIGKTFDMKCQFYILFEITGAIGTRLIIDAVTQKRTFGHYTQVLVDIDISRRLIYEVMVEREGWLIMSGSRISVHTAKIPLVLIPRSLFTSHG